MRIYLQGKIIVVADETTGRIDSTYQRGELRPQPNNDVTNVLVGLRITFEGNRPTFNIPIYNTADPNSRISDVAGVPYPNAQAAFIALCDILGFESGGGGGGSVTGVTASSPLASTGGATPNISFATQPDGVYSLSFVSGVATLVPSASESVGSIKAFASPTLPSNYLWANGATVLIATYPDLFAQISNTYGGNGVTNFALPNLNDRLPKGDNGSNLGTSGGSNVLTANQLPPHNHDLVGNNNIANIGNPNNNFLSSQGDSGNSQLSVSLTNPEIFNSSTIGNTGLGNPHEHPFTTVRYGICFESIGVGSAPSTPSFNQTLAVDRDSPIRALFNGIAYVAQNEIPVFIDETFPRANFQTGETYIYYGSTPVTYDYSVLPYPTPIPTGGFNFINLSVYRVRFLFDSINGDLVDFEYLQGFENIQVVDSGSGTWTGTFTNIFDNIYNIQQTLRKGNVTDISLRLVNDLNTITQEARLNQLGVFLDTYFNQKQTWYQNNVIRLAQTSTLATFFIQFPDVNLIPAGQSVVATFRPNIGGNIAFVHEILATLLTGFNLLGGSVNNSDSILQAFGKLQNQINGLLGGVFFVGFWDANTNNPSITSGVGTRGNYYIVNVAGTTNIDGISDWQVGDWIIYNGTTWGKVDNTDAVISVNGFVGAVNLVSDNIPEGVTNLYFTVARAITALTGQNISLFANNVGYLTANQSISLTGEAIGTGTTSINTTLSNSAVIGKVLTGFSETGGAVLSTDSILQAFGKIAGNISNLTPTILTTSASTYNLPSNVKEVLLVGTAENQIVNLGNATTYSVGKIVTLTSNNDEVIQVLNGGAVEILRLEPYNSVRLILINNATPAGVWSKTVTFATSDRGSNFYDNFVSTTAGQTNWTLTGAGGGSGVTATPTLLNRRSVLQLSTGTTATGRISLSKGQNGVVFGGAKTFCYETQINITTLSTVGERYILSVGYGDSTAAGDHLDGVYFEYNEGTNGNFWLLKTASNGIRTTFVTGVAVVINTWVKLRIEVNRGGDNVRYFIDNVLVNSISTNIPNTVGRNTDLIYKLEKTAGSTARLVFLDYTIENLYQNR